MKKLLVTVCMSLFLLTANPTAAQTQESLVEEMCKHVYTLSDNVMLLRQHGMPMHEVRSMLLSQTDSDMALQIIDAVISDAYAAPRLHGNNAIESAAVEFANKNYRECLLTLGGAT